MATPLKFSAGGGVYAITATPIAVDLTPLVGRLVVLFCDEQKIHFSGAADGSSTALVTTATAASMTALVADKLAAGMKSVPRLVRADMPFLIVATSTGSGTLFVKPVSEKDPSQ